MVKRFKQINDVVLAASFLLKILKNSRLNFRTIGVPLNCSNDLHSQSILICCIDTTKCPTECSISQMINYEVFHRFAKFHVLKPYKMSGILATIYTIIATLIR